MLRSCLWVDRPITAMLPSGFQSYVCASGSGRWLASLTSVLLITACATARPTLPEAEVPALIMQGVCAPYVLDGASEAQVLARLEGRWRRRPPELFSSPPPGPILYRRARLGAADAVLSLDRANDAGLVPGFRRMRGCQLIVAGELRDAVRQAARSGAGSRSGFRERPGSGIFDIVFCRARPNGGVDWVAATSYEDGRAGFTVGGDDIARVRPCT